MISFISCPNLHIIQFVVTVQNNKILLTCAWWYENLHLNEIIMILGFIIHTNVTCSHFLFPEILSQLASYLTQDSTQCSQPYFSRNKWRWKRYRKTLISKDSNLLSGWLLAKEKRMSLKRDKLRLSAVVCNNNVVPWD